MVDPFDVWATDVVPVKDEEGVKALAAVVKVAIAASENFILFYLFDGIELCSYQLVKEDLTI